MADKDKVNTQVLFTQDALDAVGAARQYVATELHNKRNLEQAAIFLQVYNDAMLSLDTLQQQVASLQQQCASTQVQLDSLQHTYQQEQSKYVALTKEVQQQYSVAVVDMKQRMDDAILQHNTDIALFEQKEREASLATQSIIDELNNKVTVKRQELADVTEQYDKVAAMLHSLARQMSTTV